MACARGHSFDIARRGYVNLLQPQDKRSKNPGDSAEAVAGRLRLHELGVTLPLLRGIEEMVSASKEDIVLDAGCGDGFYLGTMAREVGFEAHGVDISTAAIDAAARRYPECEWVVANADLVLPFADGSFSLVFSITGRMNAAEFRRVLRDDGRLLVAIPAADDLIELRGAGRDRTERTIGAFAPHFRVAGRGRATTQAELDAGSVRDVLNAIYRPMQAKPVEAGRVTFSLDLLLFRASR